MKNGNTKIDPNTKWHTGHPVPKEDLNQDRLRKLEAAKRGNGN